MNCDFIDIDKEIPNVMQAIQPFTMEGELELYYSNIPYLSWSGLVDYATTKNKRLCDHWKNKNYYIVFHSIAEKPIMY